MTKDNAKDYLPLVQALAEGKTIQCNYNGGEWVDCDILTFEPPARNYRIKPVLRRWWLVPGNTAPLWDYKPIGMPGSIEVVEVMRQ